MQWWMLRVIVVRSPVFGQQEVEHVVDRDRAHEAVRGVDHRHRDEVVAREHAGNLGGRRRGGHRVDTFVDDRAETCQLLAAADIQPLVYDQPWNRNRHNLQTVANWQEIRAMLQLNDEDPR